jgi:hypothetical protein
MNNFNLPMEELLAGEINWFGGGADEVSSLKPMVEASGLVDEWPEWMCGRNSARAVRVTALLTRLLFPKNIETQLFADMDDDGLSFDITFAGIDGITQWLGESVEQQARVRSTSGLLRWGLIGVAPRIALGAVGLETELPPLGYSVDCRTRTIVHVAPLLQQHANQIAHLAPQK